MRLNCSLIVATALLMPGATGIAQAAPEPNRPASAEAPRPAPELFLALGAGDVDGVKALLAKGVSPHVRNTLGMTPLMLAAGMGNLEMARILLDAGADINATSMFGTPLLFATMMESPEAARYLLEKGASMTTSRPDRISPLMMAARGGDPELVKQLLARKADPQAVDNSGATALSHAARHGSAAAARVLLDAGAKVDVPDADGWTPLIHAAVNGRVDVVRLLIARKANVNTVDKKGRSALVATASYGDHPEVVRELLAAGAQPGVRDGKGRTALMLAQARGYEGTAKLLRERGAQLPAGWKPSERTPRQAAEAALKPVEHSMGVFLKRTGCVSCHHEGMGRWATGVAAASGLRVNDAVARDQAKRILTELGGLKPLHDAGLADPTKVKDVPIVDIGDIAPTYGSVLPGMKLHGAAGTPELASAAAFLGRLQMPTGEWIFGFQRVPVQSSFFTSTATAISTLRSYEPAGQPADLDTRIARAKEWLLKTPAVRNEDRVFRLLGLQWAGASAAEKAKAIEELRAQQRPDGGWAQENGMTSDAYATGSAVYALRVAGDLPASDPTIRRGVRFLTRTQEDDGTWYVYKRAIPANNYFDSEFPYGQSQFISFAATGWGLMALCVADENAAPQVTRGAAAQAPAAR